MKIKTLLTMCGLAVVLGAQTIFAVPSYISLVPDASVNSCSTCHVASGPPARNPFGNDFSLTHTWNAALAAKDSDGDGFTNGQELGDPNGTGTPMAGAQVTNPGDPASHPTVAATAPTMAMQPMSQTVTAGANVSFSVMANGTAPLSYQWTKNGANITGATSAMLALNSVTTADAGSYAVKVSNSAGSVTSAAATLTVNAAVVAPAMAMQPMSQTVTAGANVSFSVTASGTAPLSYQWTKNGANITGATSATLALNSVTTADAGSYAVKVSNSAGSVTSSAATLTVNAAVVAPTMAMQPMSQTVTAGANVSFSVTASGTAPLSYQWTKNGANITGATSATLALNSVTTADAGSYAVKVSNSAGSVTSAAATLTVNAAVVAPTMAMQPMSQTVTAGANVSFSVTASGTAPLSYQWTKNGANITGATSATLALNSVTTADAGSYAVKVSNSAGSVTSSAATLTVNAAAVAPAITMQPGSRTVVAGASVSFSVMVTGTAPLNYQWTKNGTTIAGATSATLTLNNVTTADQGSYAVKVSNSAGSVTSSAATLTVNPAPVALSIALSSPTNGASFVAPAQVPVAVAVSATSGVETVGIFDGTNLVGTVSAAPYTLTLSNVLAGEHILTAVVRDNTGATATSEPVTISVENTPTPPSSNAAPVVKLLLPKDGATMAAPARVMLVARAMDTNGSIAKVEFFNGTTRLGTGVPFKADDDGQETEDARNGTLYFLVVNRLPAGHYVLTAKATDNQGAVTVSAPVHLTVKWATHRVPRRND